MVPTHRAQMCVALLFVLVLHVTQAKWLPIERRKPSEVTRELFTDYMNHGKLLVVEGGAADWPALEEWSLQWFVDRFPQDRIQVRSAHSMPYQERPTLTLEEYARWVVGKEDGRHYFSWVNNDEGVSERMIQPYIRLPPYFPARAHTHWHPDWIYFGTKGSGIDRHTDSMCEAKFSVHLRGEKEWILSDALESNPDVYSTTLHPGDILLFYPQYWHQTNTLSDTSISFNSYFDWDNPDNPYLRKCVRVAKSNPVIHEKYAKCFSDEAASAALSLDMVQAICAELMRDRSGGVSAKMMEAMCADPEAYMEEMAATAAQQKPQWVFSNHEEL